MTPRCSFLPLTRGEPGMLPGLLNHGFEFGHPHGEAVHGNGLDTHFAKRISNKAVPKVFLIQAYVRDGGKFAGKTGLGLDFPCRVCQDFGLGGSARHRQSLDEAARTVAPVSEVEAHGIAGKGKLFGVYASFDAIPDARLFEDLRTVRPNGPSAFGNSGPAG